MGDMLDAKKIRLVNYITAVQDEAFLDLLEKLFEGTVDGSLISADEQIRALENLLEPIEEKIDLQKILKEQNYQGPNKRRFKRLVEELNIQEPIEDLVAL